jgi:hypothetical protein
VTKKGTAQLATVFVLAAGLGIGLVRTAGWKLQSFAATRRAPEQNPQDAIYSMLEAARTGDVKRYVGNFTGPLEASLRQTLAETSEGGFSKYLRESNSEIQGVAVSDPQIISAFQAAIRVEYIYRDRNQAQMFFLDKASTGWKISRTDGEERVKTLIPYGTPVK